MNPEERYYVYEHWRLDRDECFYVGKGTGKRAYATSLRNAHWQNIVKKLERMGFAFEVRIVSCGLTEAAAFKLEQDRIAFWWDQVDLANMTKGGEGTIGFTYVHEEATKQKIGAALKGRQFSERTKQKMSRSGKGRVMPDDWKKAISTALRGRPAHNKGKAFSKETREKMSASQTTAWMTRRKSKTTTEEGK